MSLNPNLIAITLGGGAILGTFFIINKFVDASPEMRQSELLASNTGNRSVGESCGTNLECSSTGTKGGPGSTAQDQVGCCSGTCKFKRKGGLGIYWCPEDQRSLPKSEAEKESERKVNPSVVIKDFDTKGIGQTCTFHTDCSSTGDAGDGPVGIGARIGCCNSQCTFFRKDYLGTYWCPDVCAKSFLGPQGNCDEIQDEKDYKASHIKKRAVNL